VPKADWVVKHGSNIADLRAALDWAFAPGGNPSLGVRVAAALAPLWFKMLLLLAELRRYLEHAIAVSEATVEIDDAVRIRLNIELGHAVGPGVAWPDKLEHGGDSSETRRKPARERSGEGEIGS
jgi:hypothetical protein